MQSKVFMTTMRSACTKVCLHRASHLEHRSFVLHHASNDGDIAPTMQDMLCSSRGRDHSILNATGRK